MSRINIDDGFLVSAEFLALQRKLPRFVAEGVVVRLMKVGQLFYSKLDPQNGEPLRLPIPKKMFELEEFPQEVISLGFVNEVEDGYFLDNSEELFGWLISKKIASWKGGLSTKNNRLVKPIGSPQAGLEDGVKASPPVPVPVPVPVPDNTLAQEDIIHPPCAQNLLVENNYIKTLGRIYAEHYPRKVGRTKGLAILGKKIKTEKQLRDFEQAVKNYAEDVRVMGTEPEFIKHFSTFANCWEDYVDFKSPEAESREDYLKTVKELYGTDWDNLVSVAGGSRD